MNVYYFNPKSGLNKGKRFIVGIDNEGFEESRAANWCERYLASYNSGHLQVIELRPDGRYKRQVTPKNTLAPDLFDIAKFFLRKGKHVSPFRKDNDVCCLVENEDGVKSLDAWKTNE